MNFLTSHFPPTSMNSNTPESAKTLDSSAKEQHRKFQVRLPALHQVIQPQTSKTSTYIASNRDEFSLSTPITQSKLVVGHISSQIALSQETQISMELIFASYSFNPSLHCLSLWMASDRPSCLDRQTLY